MTKDEFKEKVMPIVRHFAFVAGAAVVGIVIQTGNDYLVPALQEALPNSKVFVPMVTTGFGFLAGLYAKSPLNKKGNV